jgi:LacI family transcriptional regulator
MKRDIVCFFQSSGRHEIRRLEGVYAFAREHGWHVLSIERNLQRSDIHRVLDFWSPIGCIIEGVVDEETATPRNFGRTPVVFCDVAPSICGNRTWERRAATAFIKHDSAATTHLAVRELKSLGRETLGYVGFIEPTYWSDERAAAFRSETADGGKSAHLFLYDRNHPFKDALDLQIRLRQWLKKLPKPCSILAANDFMGEQTLAACAELGIDVPYQIALIGIDNEEVRCEHLRPTLTSVEPDFRKAGYLAAETLADIVSGTGNTGGYRTFGPARIVRRQSTAVTPVKSVKVSEALETIRLKACSGIKASEILSQMGGSRSAAERLFRKITGCSVLEKLNGRKLEEVKNLLSNPEVKIESLADFCGYRSTSFLRKHFKEKTGMTMQEWRSRL